MSSGNRKWMLLAAVVLAVALCGVGTLYAGTYLDSPHGDETTGVYRDSAYDRGHCAQCHDPHVGTTGGYNLVSSINDNAICYTGGGGGGCHADTEPTTQYPCSESDRIAGTDNANGYYFERSSSGVNNRCRWPGQNTYNSTGSGVGRDGVTTKYYSPHYYNPNSTMPKEDNNQRGICSNCHNPHGVSGGSLDTQLDMLTNIYNTPGLTTNYDLCFNNGTTGCHSSGGVAAVNIKQFYDIADEQAGHQIRGSSKSIVGSLPSGIVAGDKMPCYNCHNPHGSRGADGTNPNTYLLSDQTARGWSDIDMSTATKVRTFCFGCHVASDGSASSKTVMSISMNTIPGVSGAHESSASANCYDCHGSDYASDGRNVHHPDPGGSCVSCHLSSQSSTAGTFTRRAASAEFGDTWGHLKTGRDTVGNDDCVVCHMEGESTSSPSMSTAFHKDGVVNLRDPDTGTHIQYSGSDFEFTQFSRDVTTTAIERVASVVQNQHCLKCHDSGANAGAYDSDAQVTDGSATNPFNQSGVSVLDVDSQFSTTNDTFHPVEGPQNNDYCDTDTMNTFNQSSKTPGNKDEGDLITCFDCHNSSPELSVGTVVAHGGSGTLRANYTRGNYGTPLCLKCHKASVYWVTSSTTVTSSAFGPNTWQWNNKNSTWDSKPDAGHANGSYASGSRHAASQQGFQTCGCLCCHSRTWSGTQPARPAAAEDTHGYNALSGGGNWGTGAPPYSFWRATDAIDDWGPRNYTYSDRGYCEDGGTYDMCGQGRGTYTYTPGGNY